MYDHIGIKVRDLTASVRFYEAVLAPLHWGLCARDDHGASFGPRNEPALYLYPTQEPGAAGAHIALRAKARKAVRQFHEEGLRAGGSDHGAPATRVDYGANYYAAFLLDPDGNNVEAVCFAEE